jgi:hypothetical protein
MKLNGWIAMGCAVLGFCAVSVSDVEAQLPPVPEGATAIAQGLFGPRGLKFGPDGNLYVATSGTGGTYSTAEHCPELQVPMAVGGPYTNGKTASIVKVDSKGHVTTVATGFPSALSQRPDVNGVADIAFMDGELYAVTAGGGCSHGSFIPNMVAKIDQKTGHWTMLANLSEAVKRTPAARVGDDFEADGVFYSMIAAQGKLYTVDTNHAQIWSVTKKGAVEMVTDFSQTFGPNFDPTALVASEGGLLVGTLGQFPITPGLSNLETLKPGCDTTSACGPGTLHVTTSVSGFTTILAMDRGPDGLLYALELSVPPPMSEGPQFPTPGDGKVVRIRNGVPEDVITGLSVPTGMTFGPDGALYVSNWGVAAAPIGQILRFNLP